MPDLVVPLTYIVLQLDLVKRGHDAARQRFRFFVGNPKECGIWQEGNRAEPEWAVQPGSILTVSQAPTEHLLAHLELSPSCRLK